MRKCFVIQPFDGGIFDKRYEDVFEPAIKDAGLEAYRVDRDPAASIPIVEIEEGIQDSEVCLVEITKDNPNVWFELGYAIAKKKEVVMICSSERTERFPFDVQHRKIIKYTNESASDFTKLREQIAARIIALLKKQKDIQTVAARSPLADSEGLSTYEMLALVTATQNQLSPNETVPAHRVKEDMLKAGFTEIAASLGLNKLHSKEFIEFSIEQDWNGNSYSTVQVTSKGLDWLFKNEDKLVLKADDEILKADDDIPF